MGKTENVDIPGEMTTEFIHDVMYVPLRTRRCLVHFWPTTFSIETLVKRRNRMYFYKRSQGLGHGDQGQTNVWIFLSYYELSK